MAPFEEARAGLADSNSASFVKYYNSELNKRKYDRMLEILGTKMLGWDGLGFAAEELDITRQWLRARANSIEGGKVHFLNIEPSSGQLGICHCCWEYWILLH